jgi:hypothetical protein
MSFFDRVRIFFDRLKSLHKQLGAVYVILLLTVLVVLLGALQSRLTAHPPGSVTLAWDPTPSPCLTEFGYNLYRGEKSGSYSAQPVNKQLIKEPKYTDTSVLAGKTYYYVVKAKCGNAESNPSNEMKVDVPYKRSKGKNYYAT